MLHDTMQNLLVARGRDWGHLPHTNQVLRAFEIVEEIYGTPKNILEFGFNLGFSASMQLEMFPQAFLASYDTRRWRANGGIQPCPQHLKDIDYMRMCDVVSQIYGDRFKFHHITSANAPFDYDRDMFDYVFVDGGHKFYDVFTDLTNCVNMNIPCWVVDNVNSQSEVYDAFTQFDVDILFEHSYKQIDSKGRERYNTIMTVHNNVYQQRAKVSAS